MFATVYVTVLNSMALFTYLHVSERTISLPLLVLVSNSPASTSPFLFIQLSSSAYSLLL
jgi:hypothetical protein